MPEHTPLRDTNTHPTQPSSQRRRVTDFKCPTCQLSIGIGDETVGYLPQGEDGPVAIRHINNGCTVALGRVVSEIQAVLASPRWRMPGTEEDAIEDLSNTIQFKDDERRALIAAVYGTYTTDTLSDSTTPIARAIAKLQAAA